MANRFQEAESDLRHRARRALVALCVEEGEEACPANRYATGLLFVSVS
jgi:hypothetical protein